MMSVLHCGVPRSPSRLALPNGSKNPDEIHADPIAGSLLPRVFNESLGRAITRGYDVFVMLHSDVAAPPGWLTQMLAMQDAYQADVLSVCVPLKDSRRLTSTAVHTEAEQYRRLTIDECQTKCGVVFDTQDPYLQSIGATTLLVNTGLMAMRLKRFWLRRWHGFQIRSRMVYGPDEVRIDTVSEDWDMSEQLAALDCKVCGTAAIPTQHFGSQVYASTPATPAAPVQEVRK